MKKSQPVREKGKGIRENATISPFSLLPSPFRLRFSAAC
jgi:hypothetical protein